MTQRCFGLGGLGRRWRESVARPLSHGAPLVSPSNLNPLALRKDGAARSVGSTNIWKRLKPIARVAFAGRGEELRRCAGGAVRGEPVDLRYLAAVGVAGHRVADDHGADQPVTVH